MGFFGSRNGVFSSQQSFFPGFGFSVPFGFFGSRRGCFRFPSKHGVSGSHLWVFSVPVFFLAVPVCYECVSFRPVPVMGVFGCASPLLLLLLMLLLLLFCCSVVLLLLLLLLDFVDGTGAGGVGAVRGGNLKK